MVNIKSGIILLLAYWSIALVANDNFEIRSSVSKSKMYQNESVILTLSVNGADKDLYKEIMRPKLDQQFTIISTSQSSSFSFVNGVANRSREYRYTLRPIKPGIFIIDPFNVNYKGKAYSTNPIRMVVRKGQSQRANQGQSSTVRSQPTVTRRQMAPQQQRRNRTKSIFLENSISTTNIFLGESIDYSVKLYRRVSLWSSISIEQDDIQGVWQNSFDVRPERVVRKNGQRYYELELLKKKIRPLTIGQLTVPPLTARFVVDPFSGEYQLVSDAITINVNALPEPSPPSFSGAIGRYTMAVTQPVLNEESRAIQIQVKIMGDGPISEIKPPIIQDTMDYRVLSAPKSNDNQKENMQIFDYVIIPKITGEISIPPIEFSFFSTSDMAYVTLNSKRVTFNATLDSLSPSKAAFNAQEDIRFLKSNDIVRTLVIILNHPIVFNSILVINAIFTVLLLVNIAKKKDLFRRNSPQKSRRKIIRHIQNLSEQTTLTEMEGVLVDVLNYFTNYDHPSLSPRDVEFSLIHAELSDPLVKGTMQWIKNTQLQRYSKDKISNSNHSNSESLKRILNNIILEKEQQ